MLCLKSINAAGQPPFFSSPKTSTPERFVLLQLITYTTVMAYIILASGTVAAGIVLTFIVIAITRLLGINIVDENLWVLGIPAVLSLIINITALELYRNYQKKKD